MLNQDNSQPRPQPEELLTPREACGVLKCGLTRLYALMGDGSLHSVKMGKLRRIPRSSLNQFISGLGA